MQFFALCAHTTVTKYFNAEHSDTSVLVDDVRFTFMATGQEDHGPGDVTQSLHYLLHTTGASCLPAISVRIIPPLAGWQVSGNQGKSNLTPANTPMKN